LNPDLWTIQGDAGNIDQIIMNLALNARDAIPDGGEITITTDNIRIKSDPSTRVEQEHIGEFICLTVSDTGTGVDEDTLQRIFDPFFTTKQEGEGTGLGLSVVYGIVKQHDGWITVNSTPGKGSIFNVYFPATHKPISTESQSPVSHSDLQGHGERILLVEDDNMVRDLSRKILKKNGYEVFEATNFLEAKEIFKREQGEFDLLFSDVVLPKGKGVQLADDCLSENPAIHILLSSGYTDRKSQWKTIQKKGYKFLPKPYSLDELLQNVKKVLHPG
jgi:CheY-like chemotaxis protein